MLKTKEIIDLIESFAPPELTESWDNSGWQINLDRQNTEKICLCLSVTTDVVQQAIEENCDLIISHHPLFFEKSNKLLSSNINHKTAITAIKHGLQIYCAHTNMDKAQEGLNAEMAKRLELKDIERINEYVIKGNLNKEYELSEFSGYLKKLFEIDKIKIINPLNKSKISTAAVCCGSGSEFVNDVEADIFITSDIKYHNALNITDKIALDIGHFESEKFVVDLFAKIFKNKDVKIFTAKEKTPWEII